MKIVEQFRVIILTLRRPQITKGKKKPMKTMCLAVKTAVLRGFLGFEPQNSTKTEKITKTNVNIGQQKVLHG